MKLAFMLFLYALMTAASLGLLAELLKWAFPGMRRVLPLAAVLVLSLFLPAGALLPDGPVCWFFQRWGNIFSGFYLYFFAPLLLVWLLLLPARLAHSRRSRIPWTPARGFSALLLAALLVLTVTVNVLGMRTARDIRITGYQVPKETLGQEEPLRIVLVADLHMGVTSSPELYEDMAEKINSCRPDLVLVAGDLVTSSYRAMGRPEAYAAALGEIRSQYGVYAVYGNHDVDEPLLGGFTYADREKALRNPELPAFLESCGWTVLEDETAVIPELNGLIIAGRRDLARPGDGVAERKTLSALLTGSDLGAPLILLQHEPVELDRLDVQGVDLALSGHTHDGQIFPGNLLTRLMSQQSRGMRQWGATTVVVTSGIGTYGPPIRVGTISEIVVIDVN